MHSSKHYILLALRIAPQPRRARGNMHSNTLLTLLSLLGRASAHGNKHLKPRQYKTRGRRRGLDELAGHLDPGRRLVQPGPRTRRT